MIRVGVIGVGAMGRNHARVLHDLANVELAGMADQDAATAQQVGAATGTRGYESYQELLERERPQAVVVAVPSDSHHRVVLDALAAGCHVLVEKPIAATVEQADELVRVASKAKKVLDWSSRIKFKELVRLMVEADMAVASRDAHYLHADVKH